MTEEDKMYLSSLEIEVACLRSVIAEYGSDHSEFTQWIKANVMAELRNHLRRPS